MTKLRQESDNKVSEEQLCQKARAILDTMVADLSSKKVIR
jgi:hypothetical protein